MIAANNRICDAAIEMSDKEIAPVSATKTKASEQRPLSSQIVAGRFKKTAHERPEPVRLIPFWMTACLERMSTSGEKILPQDLTAGNLRILYGSCGASPCWA